MNRSTTNHQLVQPKQAGSGQEPTNIPRRTVIGGALVALLSFPGRIDGARKCRAQRFVRRPTEGTLWARG